MTSRPATRPYSNDNRGHDLNDLHHRPHIETLPPVLQRMHDFRLPEDVKCGEPHASTAVFKDSAIARLLLDGFRPSSQLPQKQSTPRLIPRPITAPQSLQPVSPIIASSEGHGRRRSENDCRSECRPVVTKHYLSAPTPQCSPIVEFPARKSSGLINTSQCNSTSASNTITKSDVRDPRVSGSPLAISYHDEIASPPGRRRYRCPMAIESSEGRQTVSIAPTSPRRQYLPCDGLADDSSASSVSLRALLLRRREPEVAAIESFAPQHRFEADVTSRSAYHVIKPTTFSFLLNSCTDSVDVAADAAADKDKGCHDNRDNRDDNRDSYGSSRNFPSHLHQRWSQQKFRIFDGKSDDGVRSEDSPKCSRRFRRTDPKSSVTVDGSSGASTGNERGKKTSRKAIILDANFILKTEPIDEENTEHFWRPSHTPSAVEMNDFDVPSTHQYRYSTADRTVATASKLRIFPASTENVMDDDGVASTNVPDRSTNVKQRSSYSRNVSTGGRLVDVSTANTASSGARPSVRTDDNSPSSQRQVQWCRGLGADRNVITDDRGQFALFDESRDGTAWKTSSELCQLDRIVDEAETPRQRPTDHRPSSLIYTASPVGVLTAPGYLLPLPCLSHKVVVDGARGDAASPCSARLSSEQSTDQLENKNGEICKTDSSRIDSAGHLDRSAFSSSSSSSLTLKRTRVNDVDSREAIELAQRRLPRKRYRYDDTISGIISNGCSTPLKDETASMSGYNFQSIAPRLTSSSSNKEDDEGGSGVSGNDGDQPIDFRYRRDDVTGDVTDVGVQCDIWREVSTSPFSVVHRPSSGELRDSAGNADGAAAAGPRISTSSPMTVVVGGRTVAADAGAWCRPCGIWFTDQVLYSIHAGCHTMNGGAGGVCNADLFSCNVCGRQCLDRYAFNTHLVRGHEMFTVYADEEDNEIELPFPPPSTSATDNDWLRVDRPPSLRSINSRSLPGGHHGHYAASGNGVKCDLLSRNVSDLTSVNYQQSKLAEVS